MTKPVDLEEARELAKRFTAALGYTAVVHMMQRLADEVEHLRNKAEEAGAQCPACRGSGWTEQGKYDQCPHPRCQHGVLVGRPPEKSKVEQLCEDVNRRVLSRDDVERIFACIRFCGNVSTDALIDRKLSSPAVR